MTSQHHNFIKKTNITLTEEIDNLIQVVVQNRLTTHEVQRVSTSEPLKIVASSTPNIVASPTANGRHEPNIPIISQENSIISTHWYPNRSKFTQYPLTKSQEHHELNLVIDETTGESLTYQKFIKRPKYSLHCNTSCANELG